MKTPVMSNDNKQDAVLQIGLKAGLKAATGSPVSFMGGNIHYLPALGIALLLALALFIGSLNLGFEQFIELEIFRFLIISGVGAFVLLALNGFLKKRTVGLHIQSHTIKLTPGFPNLKRHELPAASIVDVSSDQSLMGRLTRSGTINLITDKGEKFSAIGLGNSDGAHALISLQVAAARAASDHKRLRRMEIERWASSTTPLNIVNSNNTNTSTAVS